MGYDVIYVTHHNPPASQTDGQTDDMRWQDRALHYIAYNSASRGKDVIALACK